LKGGKGGSAGTHLRLENGGDEKLSHFLRKEKGGISNEPKLLWERGSQNIDKISLSLAAPACNKTHESMGVS